MNNSCPLCGNQLISSSPVKGTFGQLYDCPQCGEFTLDIDLIKKIHLTEKFYLLAGYLFETNNKNFKVADGIFTVERFEEFIASPLIPHKISKKPIKALKFLNNHTNTYSEIIDIPIAAMYAKNLNEAISILNDLKGKGYISNFTLSGIHGDKNRIPQAMITLDGMRYIEEYEHNNVGKPDQAFVAMWFSKENPIPDNVWENIIKPGCLAAGYNAVRVDGQEFNDSVVDEIIALIKESAFAVVDFSGYRGGVYYEAGYAKGIGKEVINLCHKEWFDDHNTPNHAVHFDVNHYNFIVWETGKEKKARIQLSNRIRATVGMGKYKEEKK